MGDVSSISGNLPVLYGVRPIRSAGEALRPDDGVATTAGFASPSDGGTSGRLGAGVGGSVPDGSRRETDHAVTGRTRVDGADTGRTETGRTGFRDEDGDDPRRRAAAAGRGLVPLSRFDPGGFDPGALDGEPSDGTDAGARIVDGLRRRVAIAAYENANRGPTGGPLLTDVKV